MKMLIRLEPHFVPFNYHFMYISFIKQALKLENESLYNEYYEDNQNKQKNFSFALEFKNYKLNKHGYDVSGEVLWYITSVDADFIIDLYNGLTKQKKLQYKNSSFDVKKITLMKEKELKTEECLVQTLSPIHIIDKNGRPVHPENGSFQTEFNYISDMILKNVRGYGLQKEITITPIKFKKVVPHLYEDEKRTYTEAFKGVFHLKGSKEDLKILLQTGVSFKKSSGFGCIELL